MDIPGILPASLLAERLETLAYLYRRTDVAVADLGSELASIEPESSGTRKPLTEALPGALSWVLFLVGMPGDDPLDGGPDIRPPVPQAG